MHTAEQNHTLKPLREEWGREVESVKQKVFSLIKHCKPLNLVK